MKKFILFPFLIICFHISAQQPPKTATFYAFDNNTPQIQLVSPTNGSVNEIATADDGDFVIYMGGVFTGDRIRIAQSTGFVGINNPVPSRQLDVTGSANVSSFIFSNKLRLAGNTANNDWVLGLDGDQIIQEGKLCIVSPNPADNDPNTYEEFGLIVSNPTETSKWNIQHNNEFLDLDFWYNEELKGYFDAIGGNYVVVSDRNSKKDIENIGSVLEKIQKLEPVKYRYISNSADSKRSVGFIAQNVQKVFPELASTKDGHMGVSYGQFSVVAIKAIQEQQAIIENLQNEITEIKELLKDK